MSNAKNISYEQMFMQDYDNYVFRNLVSEKPRVQESSGANTIDIVGDVAKEVGSMIGQSAKEYGTYLKETPVTESVPATAEAATKGVTSAALGIGGDLESIARGIYSALQTQEGKSKLESFLQGLGQDTALPSTEDVATIINKLTGESAKGTGLVEGTGQLLAPVGIISKAAKGISKTAKKMKAK